MRIRRRPQAQALIPSPPLHHHSESSTAPYQPLPPPPPNAAANQHRWPPRKEEENNLAELHRPNVDEPSRPAHPKGNNVVGGRSGSNPGSGGGGGAQRRQAGAGAAAADGHGSIENGNRDDYEWPVINAAGQGLANGSALALPAAPVQAKEGIKSDGHKRRRGTAVLLEGSRCSRVNGRGWRCSQSTLVGYSLCEHHLGKGRQSRSAANGGSSGGGTKLGRTEPARSRKNAAAMAVVTLEASEPSTLRHVDLRSIDGMYSEMGEEFAW